MMPEKKHEPGEDGRVEIQTQTFILRVWLKSRQGAGREWRGRIQHVQSGEIQYCQNLDAVIAYVEKVLDERQDGTG